MGSRCPALNPEILDEICRWSYQSSLPSARTGATMAPPLGGRGGVYMFGGKGIAVMFEQLFEFVDPFFDQACLPGLWGGWGLGVGCQECTANSSCVPPLLFAPVDANNHARNFPIKNSPVLRPQVSFGIG